jgi:hypothetical protein
MWLSYVDRHISLSYAHSIDPCHYHILIDWMYGPGCVCVCVRMCMGILLNGHASLVHMDGLAWMYVCMCMYVYVWAWMYVCTYVCMCMCMGIRPWCSCYTSCPIHSHQYHMFSDMYISKILKIIGMLECMLYTYHIYISKNIWYWCINISSYVAIWYVYSIQSTMPIIFSI